MQGGATQNLAPKINVLALLQTFHYLSLCNSGKIFFTFTFGKCRSLHRSKKFTVISYTCFKC